MHNKNKNLLKHLLAGATLIACNKANHIHTQYTLQMHCPIARLPEETKKNNRN